MVREAGETSPIFDIISGDMLVQLARPRAINATRAIVTNFLALLQIKWVGTC
jgi:hypothetical protein